MSLEHEKKYAVSLMHKEDGDKSAERINKATPHQAPQRQRVSFNTRWRRPHSSGSSITASQCRTSPPKQRGWKDYIDPSINMGVPTLLMILEPNIVWGHSHELGSKLTDRRSCTEAATCRGNFFDGLDQFSRLAHGVYEGNYWQLLGDLAELEDMLVRMTHAPALLDEPVLQLPPEPELPTWDQFKPEMLPLPPAPPRSCTPQLPDFVEPDLPQVPNLPAPELVTVPPLPAAWKEVVVPDFVAPVAPKVDELHLPKLVLPPAPLLQDSAAPSPVGLPKYGHDWSGNRPFTVPVPSYTPPMLPAEPQVVPEELQDPELQEAQLLLMPEPIVMVGWLEESGEPDVVPYRPASAVDAINSSCPGVEAPKSTSDDSHAVALQCGSMIKHTADGTVNQDSSLEDLHNAWRQVQSAPASTAGAAPPAVWLNFKPPFADPPPVLLPPEPEPGPEPELQPPQDLAESPIFQPPVPQPLPEFNEPPLVLPSWSNPREPLPVGFLRGTAPVLIMDVSGTMHPARRGQFLRVKKCVAQLLEPDGELFTASTVFDVLAFSGSCWSWSAAYAGKQALLASALQGSYGGTRQAGGRQAGQLTQTTSITRSRTQWHKQQLQQRWQQQAQQRPVSASANSTDGEGMMAAEHDGPQHLPESCAAAQRVSIKETSEQCGSVATQRPYSAAAAARPEAQSTRFARPATADTAGSDMNRNKRLDTQLTMANDNRTKEVSNNLVSQQLHHDQQQHGGSPLRLSSCEHLAEARSWVLNWPEAVGSTNLLPALMTAHQYTCDVGLSSCSGGSSTGSSNTVDCFYLFSDGLADDAAACLAWVREQRDLGNPIRPVHTVGFFPRNGSPAGERFLSQLAAATNGTFQVYNADLPVAAASAALVRAARQGGGQLHSQCTPTAAEGRKVAAACGNRKVWDASLQSFVAVESQKEDEATRDERQWAEEKLKQRRLDNKRLGRRESLTVMLEILRQQHHKERVLPAMAQHQRELLQLKAAHQTACAAVATANELAVRQAQRLHAVAVQQVQQDNQRRVAAAKQAHAAAIQQWQQAYNKAHAEWEQAVAAAKERAAAATGSAAQVLGATLTGALPLDCVSHVVEVCSKPGQHKMDPSEAVHSVASLQFSSLVFKPQHPASSVECTPRLLGAAADDTSVQQQQQQEQLAVSHPARYLAAATSSRPVSAPGSRCSTASSTAQGLNHHAAEVQQPAAAVSSSGAGTSSTTATGSAKTKANDRPKSAASSGISSRRGSSSGGSTRSSSTKHRNSTGKSISTPGSLSKSVSGVSADQLDNMQQGIVQTGEKLYSKSSPGTWVTASEADAAAKVCVASDAQAVDAINRQALQQIYADWHQQVVQVEQHNTSALHVYQQESTTHAARRAAYLERHAAWEREVQELQQRAKQKHESAVASAAAENSRLAELHGQEVADKVARDAAHAKLVSDQAAARAFAVRQHETAVSAAKAAHEAAVVAAKELYRQQQAEVAEEYRQDLAAAQQQHDMLVQQIREQNRLAREAHKAASDAHRAAALENKRRLALHSEELQAAALQLAAANEAALQQARQEYKAYCAQLTELHQQQQTAVQADWLAAKAAVQERNEEATEAARARYAAAVDALLHEHSAVCKELTQQHEVELAAVRSRNSKLLPQVQIANLALSELARVKAFAAHIRSCAAKLRLGVNFLTDTPNLDRVVEMSALTDALKAAFPDVTEPRQYPWPMTTHVDSKQRVTVDSVGARQREHGLSNINLTDVSTDTGSRDLVVAAKAIIVHKHSEQKQVRPVTAPARGVSGDIKASHVSSNVDQPQLATKGGWTARSPPLADFHRAVQDPTVLLLQQLKRPHSSGSTGYGSSCSQGNRQSGSLFCSKVQGHEWCIQDDGALGHTTAAVTSSSGTFSNRSRYRNSVVGVERQSLAHSSSAAMLQSMGGVISAQSRILAQRPKTAPVLVPACKTPAAAGPGLGSPKPHSSSRCQHSFDSKSGSKSAASAAVCRESSSLGKSSRPNLPARHAVEVSIAGQRIAQVLSVQQQRLQQGGGG